MSSITEDSGNANETETAVVSIDDVESIQDVPNEKTKQVTDSYSEQKEEQLEKLQSAIKAETDAKGSSNASDKETKIFGNELKNVVDSGKNQGVPESDTCQPVYLETTYFGSPKRKLSAADIVLEIHSTLKQAKLANGGNSKTIDCKLQGTVSVPTITRNISSASQRTNGLPNSDHSSRVHPRGILKNTKSEPVIIVNEPSEKFKHSDSTGVIETSKVEWPKFGKTKFGKIGTSANYFRTTQEFVNPAFELDENIPSDSKLSDIVDLVMKQQTDQGRYVHPFGQNSLYSTVFLDETPRTIQNTERIVFWLIFVIMLVGLAGAIILMAEMYKLDNQQYTVLVNTTIAS
ncbi:uncharacterized protein [Argopecten irradians]|uniref:uncharacterized protein n=1 Tax=Argopecten irradians TaxID=31199 RepID=UPI0037107B20